MSENGIHVASQSIKGKNGSSILTIFRRVPRKLRVELMKSRDFKWLRLRFLVKITHEQE
ncbi:hypothetical protein HanPSC8_Chr17g0787191 [Helianthus annuus]|nr:hypothetical protein HanPSC8_Chr17g0787191 [Helianthus annuus]